MKWIDIKNKLPNDQEWVIAFNGDVTILKYVKADQKKQMKMGDYFVAMFEKVTYWMPLPESPNKNNIEK